MTESSGSTAEFAELYVAFWSTLVRFAYALVLDIETAEDIAQDAFERLAPRWNHMVDRNHAEAYLRVTVLNRARSLHRRTAVARRFIPVFSRADEESPDPDLAEHQDVLAAVARLPRRQRAVIGLKYWADLSNAEIADALQISINTVKSATARATARLARDLKEDSRP